MYLDQWRKKEHTVQDMVSRGVSEEQRKLRAVGTAWLFAVQDDVVVSRSRASVVRLYLFRNVLPDVVVHFDTPTHLRRTARTEGPAPQRMGTRLGDTRVETGDPNRP